MPTCESCKMSNLPFSGKGERVTEFLELIHTDVCGPLSTTSRGGFSYFIKFTDDYSRLGYVYLIKYKSEAFEKFKEFKNEFEKQIGKSIKILRLDRGGEYFGTEFLKYLKKHGILSQWTPPGTPQLTGIDFALDGTCVQKLELKEESKEPHEPEVESDPVDNPVSLSTLTQPPRRSERISKAPGRYLGSHHVLLMGDDMEDPETYMKAMLDIDSKKWQKAMKS
ncbi:unnamed protein product [Prunus brigantina]